jgi:UDP-N-acetyl-D-mannosaminuronic acid dehydrogenase
MAHHQSETKIQMICVLGLGYIGLPTASMFATHGFKVTGVDVNQAVVDTLNNGDIHIQEPGLSTLVQAALRSKNLRVANEPEPADVFIIAVPTPIGVDRTANMRFVVSATESILPHLRHGNLVVLESTSPPRTTLDLVRPILEKSGLQAGTDFLLAYSPERVLPGQILRELVDNARVIGGFDHASARAGRDLYATFVEGEIILTDATTAEMVKLMENTYRDLNIAIANEFARLSERLGVDVWEAIEVANRHPRVNILRPGPGVGGHCISVDPWFLVEAAPDLTPLVRQARLVNDGQPEYVVEQLTQSLGELNGKVLTVLGLTYKADVDDVRESPAVAVVKKLRALGATVRAFDPYVKAMNGLEGVPARSLDEAISQVDGIVLLVAHRQFKALDPTRLATLVRRRFILDACHVLDRTLWEKEDFELMLLGDGKHRRITT